MADLRAAWIFPFAAVLLAAATGPAGPLPPRARPLCTLAPGTALALVRVEQDTTLPFAATDLQPMSLTQMRGRADSLLATPGTPMPAGRVRLLQLDSATRAVLAAQGVRARQPTAFLRAAPYGADCRTLRWTDSSRFVQRGEVGYVRGTLAPPDQWIAGTPVIVVPDAWNYPYPRRRGLAMRIRADAPLASAEALFSLEAALELPRPQTGAERVQADSVRRLRAIAWARANGAAAELEPARARVRSAVLAPDWEVANGMPSRLRGSYRVDLDVSGQRATWYFRTHDRPGYSWRGGDSLQTTAELLRSPYVAGYRLVGYAAPSPDSLPQAAPAGRLRTLVWLATGDRPTDPGNSARRALQGILEFQLGATPEALWDVLQPLVPPQSPMDSAMLARMNRPTPRAEKQVQIPLVVRLDAGGGVRADTSLAAGGGTLRIHLQRVDTMSVKRPWS